MSRIKETEAQAQVAVALWLDAKGYLWMHCPNEAKRSPQLGKRLKAQGMKAGFPDIVVFVPPLHKHTRHGAAIELKVGKNSPTESQRKWLDRLTENGWLTAICYGSDEAIRQLEAWGY